MSVSRRVWTIPIFVTVLLALGAASAPVTAADNPALFITFRPGPQRITVTLANNTPVGTTSGSPTVIPPGLYNLFLDDSAGVTGPEFALSGPDVNMIENMFYGEIPSATFTATFASSSTYTWRNNEQPSIVFTFVTSAATGSTSSGSTGTTSSGSGSKPGKPSTSIVGSAILPFRGALDGTVYKTGKLTLTSSSGKTVSTLKSGRYTIDVDDEASNAGFTVQRIRQTPVTVTSAKFVGSHAVTIPMKAGQWFFYSASGKKTYFIVVT